MKIMLLTISGGTETHRIGPLQSMVAVTGDEPTFIEGMRKLVQDWLRKEPLLQDQPIALVTEVLRSLHITLKDSGLTAWPVDLKELDAVFARMTNENDSGTGSR
jgi:molybdenum cofactor biosynthesis enzyme MoaA